MATLVRSAVVSYPASAIGVSHRPHTPAVTPAVVTLLPLALLRPLPPTAGKIKKVSIDFEPFKPINTSLYMCDNKFHTEALSDLLQDDDR